MPSVSGTVVIGGGSGFVGTHLSKLLQSKGYGIKIVSRMPGHNRMSWHDLTKNGLPNETVSVVNLAGQNILDIKQRWNAGFKQNVWNSRINSTQALIHAIMKADPNVRPSSFVLMTGVGIYEPSETIQYNESSQTSKHDFLSTLCHEWEKVAVPPTGTRKVIIRSGVVLGRRGGMIKQLFLPFYFGLGGPVATGKQYLPWIHIDDICRLIVYAIENDDVEGIVNGVAPQQITNAEFAKVFASALFRPSLIPVPESILNILLSKERAKVLTQGQRVIPEKATNLGFQYLYPDIVSACKEFAHLC